MAEPLIIAIDQSNLHARKILKKHARNRPLGRIENQYRYSPPQPVLSCRTVNIDVSGTRTYRARSSSDIIEEQHKLIHQVYTNARNISSAPVRRSKVRSPRQQHHSSQCTGPALRYLRVQGSSEYTDRPATTHGCRSSSSSCTCSSPRIGLDKRPKSSVSPRRAKSAIDARLTLEPDPDLVSCAHNVHLLDQCVQEQWRTDNHSLDEGQFVRGKKNEGESSLDPKTGNQWLVFGGGQRSMSAGVVDAFTTMKDSEYYSIDGSTGTQVAKQLRRGDKIRIGVNGQVHSRDLRLRNWSRDQQDWSIKMNEQKERDLQDVPLCWTDQVTREDSMIVEASVPRELPPPIDLCERKPVVFKKLLKEDSVPRIIRSPRSEGDNSKYGVNVRTKSRVGLDGKQSAAPITTISIGIQGGKGDGDGPTLTVEDILESKTQRPKKNAVAKPTIVETKPRARDLAHQSRNSKQRSSANSASMRQDSKATVSTDASPEVSMIALGADLKTESTVKLTISPPSTGRSEKESLVVEARPQTAQSDAGERRAGDKPASAGRQAPMKSQLHKTSPATGASSNSSPHNSSKPDAEYIQISRQLHVSREMESSGEQPEAAAISSVSKHNKPPPSPQPEELQGASSAPSAAIDAPSAEVNKDASQSVPVSDSSTKDETSTETKYAFNIPTADMVESDGHSVTETQDAKKEQPKTPPRKHSGKNVRVRFEDNQTVS